MFPRNGGAPNITPPTCCPPYYYRKPSWGPGRVPYFWKLHVRSARLTFRARTPWRGYLVHKSSRRICSSSSSFSVSSGSSDSHSYHGRSCSCFGHSFSDCYGCGSGSSYCFKAANTRGPREGCLGQRHCGEAHGREDAGSLG